MTLPSVLYAFDHSTDMMLRWSCTEISEALCALGHRSVIKHIFDPDFIAVATGFDVIVFYRTVTQQSLTAMHTLNRLGRLTSYIIDDYIFEPNSYYFVQDQASSIKLHMQAASFLFFPNKALAERVVTEKPVFLREPALSEATVAQYSVQPNTPAHDTFRIGLTKGHCASYTTNFCSQIIEKLAKRHMKAEFHYWHSAEWAPSLGHVRSIRHPYEHSVDAFIQSLVDSRLDVIINPLRDVREDVFNHCKCNIKWLEAGVMGIPLVTSRTRPFVESVKHGETGFLASTVEEYADVLHALSLARPEIRQAIGQAARTEILRDWTYGTRAKAFSEKVSEMLFLQRMEAGNLGANVAFFLTPLHP